MSPPSLGWIALLQLDIGGPLGGPLCSLPRQLYGIKRVHVNLGATALQRGGPQGRSQLAAPLRYIWKDHPSSMSASVGRLSRLAMRTRSKRRPVHYLVRTVGTQLANDVSRTPLDRTAAGQRWRGGSCTATSAFLMDHAQVPRFS